jgi:hypothetical protein
MRYKTIIHELLQDRYPALHERLRRERTLLATLDRLAIELKDAHSAWMNQLRRANPDRDYGQIASEALELATEDLQRRLPSESPPDETDGPLSLDAAMAYLRSHTPPA